jgi:tRNA (guanine37-N1)-methyltransferase
MEIDVVTIFPDYLAPLSLSLIGKAQEQGRLTVRVHDLRDFTRDRHRTVDDTPYGGGAGLVMRPEPWGDALAAVLATGGATGRATGDAVTAERPPVLLVPSPAGERFTQDMARALGDEPRLVFACGRYEGIDERVLVDAAHSFRVVPVSLGDYVLGGGEVAALTIIEAVARLLPGVIGNSESLVEESHEDGLLEYPVYTKPASWRGLDVPAVLTSGHHGQVNRWRRDERLRRTAQRRPDLIAALDPQALDERDRAVLDGQSPDP